MGLLEPDKVLTCEVDALVDTGATKSIIPPHVVRQLDLIIARQTMGVLADGSRVPVGVSSTIVFQIEGRETREDAYVLGDQVGGTTFQALTRFSTLQIPNDSASSRV